ncbi:MAG TPA: ABC transporter substrate-binding protein [Acidimicrobiia bacterium]
MNALSSRSRWLIVVAVFAVFVSACAGTTEDTTTTAAAEATTTSAAAEGTTTTAAQAEQGAMTYTIDIAEEAVWSDGTPITVADIECTWQAFLNTPGSLSTSGYDQITSVSAGTSDKQAVIEFATVYAPYKVLFNQILPAHTVADCNDVSGDFQTEIPVSARPWQLSEWSDQQAILVPNEAYWGDDVPVASRLVQVPRTDDGGIAALQAGEVDFIFPQAFAGIGDALAADNIQFEPGYGTNYEGLYFRQGGDVAEFPFSDPVFRQAFSMSVDRELILANIYDPIFPGSPLLQCGLWVPTIGAWCDNTQFENSFDPEGAAALLEENGWTQDGSGMWANADGVVPEIQWMVNEPNQRRADAQALMIPEFQALGFNVVADNGDAATVFQQRLPAGEYDLAMYITTAAPDPSVTAIMSCDQVPSPENNNQGQNSVFWCNEDASALMAESDVTIDEAARADLIHQVGQALVDDHVLLPLFQFPNIAAWRTDRIEGDAAAADAANYRAYNNSSNAWTPIGKEDVVVGAEQWPECINPVTECANSSWMVWTTSFAVLPAVFDTTADGQFVPTNMVASEPTVTVNE